MTNTNKCPVCKNTEYFSCSVSGESSIFSYEIGRVDLKVCTKCGCVYIGNEELDRYKENKNN